MEWKMNDDGEVKVSGRLWVSPRQHVNYLLIFSLASRNFIRIFQYTFGQFSSPDQKKKIKKSILEARRQPVPE